jgi:hypothetical protein
MADIVRRSLDKVTYAPIKPSPEDERSGAILMRRRALDKVVYAGALQARPDEIEGAKASVRSEIRLLLAPPQLR